MRSDAGSETTDEEVPPGELGGRLAGKSLGAQVLTLALWPFIEQVLSFFTSATDLVIAGRMGEGMEVAPLIEALAVAAYVGWLVFIVQGATSTGATALVARATGARDARLANRVLGQAGLLSAVIGLVFGGVLYGSANVLAGTFFGLKGEALDAAVTYLHVFAYGAPFSGIVFSLNASLRGAGDTVSPFRVMVFVNVVNIGLSWFLVFGPAQMGVDGLALGTVCGWIAGAVLALSLLHFKSVGDDVLGELTLRVRRLRPDWSLSWRILRIGLPTAAEIFGIWAIQVAIGRYISSLPIEGALGSHMIAVRLESMSFLPGFAVGVAASTLAGQYLGAGNPEQARRAVVFCWKVAVVVMGLIGVSLFIFAQKWAGIIAPDAQPLVDNAVPLVSIAGVFQPLMATCIVLGTAMRGAGATRSVLIWGLGSQILWRVVVLWSLIHFFEISLVHIWWLMGVDLLWRAGVFTWLFRSGQWQTARV